MEVTSDPQQEGDAPVEAAAATHLTHTHTVTHTSVGVSPSNPETDRDEGQLILTTRLL